jgi:hypothetical protein
MLSNEHNLTARSTSEDAKFNERQTETFSLSLKPESSGPSSRENLANIAEECVGSTINPLVSSFFELDTCLLGPTTSVGISGICR